MIDLAIKHLIREEALRLHPYQDSEGYWTVGVGHLIDGRKGGNIPIGVRSFPITKEQAMQILLDDIHKVHTPLSTGLPFWGELSKVRQVVLISMAFQLGFKGLKTFKNMLADIEAGQYKHAANEMLDSLWANQTRHRAVRLSDAMRTNDEIYLRRGA